MMAARMAPEKGPTQKIHWFSQLCETADVPKERAGFTLQQHTIFKPGWDVATAEQEARRIKLQGSLPKKNAHWIAAVCTCSRCISPEQHCTAGCHAILDLRNGYDCMALCCYACTAGQRSRSLSWPNCPKVKLPRAHLGYTWQQ